VIQHGHDPSSATIDFHWGGTPQAPDAFMGEQGSTWFWPGAIVRLDTTVLLFYSGVQSTGTPGGFQAAGWSALIVKDPTDDPGSWQTAIAKLPPLTFPVTLGTAAISDEYLYAYGIAGGRRRWRLSGARLARVRRSNGRRGRIRRRAVCRRNADARDASFSPGSRAVRRNASLFVPSGRTSFTAPCPSAGPQRARDEPSPRSLAALVDPIVATAHRSPIVILTHAHEFADAVASRVAASRVELRRVSGATMLSAPEADSV
jgi:hypothetical protein